VRFRPAAEALENEYPLLVEEYGLVAGSGGTGAARGGLGIARQIRALEDGTVFGCRGDSHLTRTEGVFGGEPGGPRSARPQSRPGGRTVLPSKVSRLVLKASESMRIETPGGGAAGVVGEYGVKETVPHPVPLPASGAREPG
jgi:N-methylhydantoinase B